MLLFPIGGLHALLWGLGLLGDGVSIHNTHVVNAVRPLPEYSTDKTYGGLVIIKSY